jgi:hypothetical protein
MLIDYADATAIVPFTFHVTDCVPMSSTHPLTGVMLNPVKINLKLFGSELRSNS